MYPDTPRLTVVNHPLATHLLTSLRDKSTPPEQYRNLANKLTNVVALEATRSMPLKPVTVTTPIRDMNTHKLAQRIVAVPILRAGLGMLEAVVGEFPDVSVGYIGLERDETTLQPTEYYLKTPKLEGANVLMLDPMLATGGSAATAAAALRREGAKDLTLVCIISAPQGIERLLAADPDIHIVTAAVDEGLTPTGFITPGLGDFGDRLFGTEE